MDYVGETRYVLCKPIKRCLVGTGFIMNVPGVELYFNFLNLLRIAQRCKGIA